MDVFPSRASGRITLFPLQRRLLTGACVLNLLLWGYLALTVRPSADPVALHATIYFDIDRVGEWYRLFFIPLAGLIVIGINTAVPLAWHGRDRLSGEIFAGVALAAQGILWLAAVTLPHY